MIDFQTHIIIGCILLAVMVTAAMSNDTKAGEKDLVVNFGNGTITFGQGASGKFETIKIEGSDTGFFWTEDGERHFCINGIEVEE